MMRQALSLSAVLLATLLASPLAATVQRHEFKDAASGQGHEEVKGQEGLAAIEDYALVLEGLDGEQEQLVQAEDEEDEDEDQDEEDAGEEEEESLLQEGEEEDEDEDEEEEQEQLEEGEDEEDKEDGDDAEGESLLQEGLEGQEAEEEEEEDEDEEEGQELEEGEEEEEPADSGEEEPADSEEEEESLLQEGEEAGEEEEQEQEFEEKAFCCFAANDKADACGSCYGNAIATEGTVFHNSSFCTQDSASCTSCGGSWCKAGTGPTLAPADDEVEAALLHEEALRSAI